MGLSEGLRQSLERYLEQSAAELDDRGAEITFRGNELEAEIERLEAAETDLHEREKRVTELRPVQERGVDLVMRTCQSGVDQDVEFGHRRQFVANRHSPTGDAFRSGTGDVAAGQRPGAA